VPAVLAAGPGPLCDGDLVSDGLCSKKYELDKHAYFKKFVAEMHPIA
jgi:hypothetical protein